MAGSSRKLSDSEWMELGLEWAAQTMSNEKLAAKYGVTRPAINKAIKRYGWSRDPVIMEALAESLKAKYSGPAFQDGPELLDGVTGGDVTEGVAGDRQQLILQHQQQWANIRLLRDDAFRLLRGLPTRLLAKPLDHDIVDPETKKIIEKRETFTLTKRINLAHKIIATFEADARAMMTAQEGERRAWGFDYKTQQDGNQVSEHEMRRRNELIDNLRAMGDQLALLQALQQQGDQPKAETPPPRPPSKPQTIEGEIA
jgi:hypothetical protein